MSSVVAIDTCAIIHFIWVDRFYLLELLGYSVITTKCVELEFVEEHPNSRNYFLKLLKQNKISLFPLEIDDIIEMANFPNSKQASNAELSCFAIAKRIGGKVMTDDNRAVKYLKKYIYSMPSVSAISLVDVPLEAYVNFYLGDHDLRSIQSTLTANKYCIKGDLVAQGAIRRLSNGL